MTTKVSPLSVQPDSTNPLQPTSFRFSLNKTPEAVYFCQSANLPGLSKAAVTQSNVFSDIKQPGDRIEFDDLTITFIVNEDLGNWIELKNWITSLAPYDSVSEENTGRKNLHLNSPHLISKIFTFDFVWRRAKRESSRATPLLLFCLCLRRRLEILRTSGDDVCVRVFPLCISSNILRWSASIVFASSAHYPLTGAETRIEK